MMEVTDKVTGYYLAARHDLSANAKCVLNSVRELDEAESDLRFDFHQISTSLSSR